MECLLISKERMIYHLDSDVKKGINSVINWFVDEEGIFNLVLSSPLNNYLYRCLESDVSEVIKFHLNKLNSVQGIYDLAMPVEVQTTPLRVADSVFAGSVRW